MLLSSFFSIPCEAVAIELPSVAVSVISGSRNEGCFNTSSRFILIWYALVDYLIHISDVFLHRLFILIASVKEWDLRVKRSADLHEIFSSVCQVKSLINFTLFLRGKLAFAFSLQILTVVAVNEDNGFLTVSQSKIYCVLSGYVVYYE